MRGLRMWVAGGTLAATLAATSGLTAKEPVGPQAPRPGSGGLFRSWFGAGKANATPKPAARTTPADKNKARADADAPPRPSKTDEAAANRAVEEAAFLRRMDVCTRLREVAAQTNDTALDRLAGQLEEQVWNLYSQRTLAGRLEPAAPAAAAKATTAQQRPSRRRAAEEAGDDGAGVVHAVTPEEKP